MTLKLQKIIPEIALDVNAIGHDYFHGPEASFKSISTASIKSIVQEHLQENEIGFETYFSIYHESIEDEIIIENEVFKKELLESNVRACMSCIVSFSIVQKENAERKPEETELEFSERLIKNSSFSYFSPVNKIKTEDRIWISLYQANAFSDALGSMILIFLANLILLLVLLFLFRHLLKLMSNYNALTKLKEEFFNSMTHEFKTPLSSIRLASRVLRENKDKDKIEIYHNLIEKESKNLE
ncbi:MAG: histidine kinase dimerization/phospho-acceptor domain-containing protein, partial [Bacteroidota bacterium]